MYSKQTTKNHTTAAAEKVRKKSFSPVYAWASPPFQYKKEITMPLQSQITSQVPQKASRAEHTSPNSPLGYLFNI